MRPPVGRVRVLIPLSGTKTLFLAALATNSHAACFPFLVLSTALLSLWSKLFFYQGCLYSLYSLTFFSSFSSILVTDCLSLREQLPVQIHAHSI